MPPISEAVKQLLIINVLMFFGTMMIFPGHDNALALYYPDSDLFRPWQIVTHMFMHENLNHLLFNMFGLYMFGSILEMHWGAKRFLIFYLLSGLGAMMLHVFTLYLEINGLESFQYQRAMASVNFNMRGASGAVFGLLAGYGMMFPNHRISLIFPPISLKAKYFVMIYAGLELILGVSNSQPGIANFAHLGGAICGALIVYFWRKTGKV